MTNTYGFELLREEEIPELKTQAKLFRHIKTGAQLLSLHNDDENKCFGISFRTPPADSTGVAHILEHSVLCGSRKYPLKDPFVEMLKGSFQTFLNAFTYPDKTCYPIASTNLQDFYNLVDVYLDTVLHPRLARETFLQQAWHYETESPDSPLIYKGVVFNEMKGAYSSPESLLGEHTQQSLFPDNTYGFDSGGDPTHIPDLTHEQLIEFHQAYYHPSNARIFFYGDDALADRLCLLGEYLDEFEQRDTHSAIPLQSRFSEPRRATYFYSIDADSAEAKKSMAAVNWLLEETSDPETILALNILRHILVGTPASPLRKALIDSGLGEDVTGGGLADHLRQAYFSTGLKGINAEDASQVEALILQTLENIAIEGIEPSALEAALNTIEFRLREQNTGGFPRGLSLMLSALKTWLHDGDPFAPLAFEAPLTAIKKGAASEPYFENLIRRFFLNNTHRTTVIIQPDRTLGARTEAAEQSRLAAARAAMSHRDVQNVIEEAEQLKVRQQTPESPEALAALPRLTLSDLERESKTIPQENMVLGSTKVLYHDLFSSGILYLDLGFDLHVLPQELLPYVSLFSRSLLQLGTDKEDFVRLTQRIGSRTGGLGQQTFTSAVRGSQEAASWLFLRGKAMAGRAGELLDIMTDILLSARFDNHDRFRQIALEEKARLEASIVPGGSGYVGQRLSAHFHEAGWAAEQMGGISYLFFLRALIAQIETDWPSVLAKLELIRQHLVNRQATLCNVTLDRENWTAVAPQIEAFLTRLPQGDTQRAAWTRQNGVSNEGFTIPAQVNYVGKAADLYALGFQEDGSASVISRYLSTSWLWQQVRVQGGAYGGGCSFDSLSGLFTFSSYRDPNLLNTLDVYDRTTQFLHELDLSSAELTRGIIGAIGAIDRYLLPDAKGFTALVRDIVGETDEIRQRRRDEILNTTQADFHAFAEILAQVQKQGQVVVIGSQEDIHEANAARPELLTVSKLL